MNKYIIIALLILPSFVFGTTVQLNNPLNVNTITDLVSIITVFLRNVAYAIAPVAVIVSGYYFLTSGGDPTKTKTARSILFWALAGVLVITIADILIDILRNSLGI